MAEWTAHILTAAGRRLQAKAEAGSVLELTRMKFGSGTETLDELDEATDLSVVEAEVIPSAATVKGEVCTVTGILLTSRLSHGFWCRQWGVFADDPDEGEILYAVLVDEKPDWLPANAPVPLSVTYALNLAVANGSILSAQIDLAGLVDVDMLNEYTHAMTRDTKYKAGDIVTSPTLPHGLVLEARTDGTTAETLVDVSAAACGDEATDGSVTWIAKRLVATSVHDEEHTIEWLHEQVERLGPRIYNLIIPTTGWRNIGGPYRFVADVPVEGIEAGMPINVAPLPAAVDAAGLCGLCPTAQSLMGAIRVFAKAMPTESIEVSLTAFSAKGGGSGGGDVPIATESTAGIVKIGDGLKVNPDGTLYVNKEKVMTEEDLVDEEQEKKDIIDDLDD
ncbi:MAG: hypothetical protein IJV64_03580 [Oscillospiraceae bacterium]|nr:hypothetical protein [Oscillospiraceae bacterium]